MRSETLSLLDAHFAGVFGIPRDAMWQGVTVRPHRGPLQGYEGFYVAMRGAGVHVSAPTSAHSTTMSRLARTAAQDLQAPDFWQDLADASGRSVVGPSIHAFSDTDPGPTEGARAPTAGDLTRLRARADDAEWEEAGWDDDPLHSFGVYRDGDLVAAANLTSFDGRPRDVGVFVAPDHRGRGLAKAAGRQAASFAIRRHGVARWRARETNLASLAVARKLGFEPWCRQLAVR